MNNNDTTNNDTTNNDDSRDNNARAKNNHFTIAQLSRELNINAKIARRRMRDAIKRDDERVVCARKRNDNDDSRVKHEFHVKYRDRIASIIAND